MDTCGLERVERFRINLNEKNFASQKNTLTSSLPQRCRAVGCASPKPRADMKSITSELLTWLVGKVSAFCLRMRGRDRITHAKLSTREQRVCLVEHVAKSFENS